MLVVRKWLLLILNSQIQHIADQQAHKDHRASLVPEAPKDQLVKLAPQVHRDQKVRTDLLFLRN